MSADIVADARWVKLGEGQKADPPLVRNHHQPRLQRPSSVLQGPRKLRNGHACLMLPPGKP
jgi:hypothetical protein